MSIRKLATLAGVVVFASFGDVCLSRGMRGAQISAANLGLLIESIRNPWIILGIFLLIGFFASYLCALSFADLTYVLPATSIGYVGMALLARFLLHEHITLLRWTGIALISLGVGFVARGPSVTVNEPEEVLADAAAGGRA